MICDVMVGFGLLDTKPWGSMRIHAPEPVLQCCMATRPWKSASWNTCCACGCDKGLGSDEFALTWLKTIRIREDPCFGNMLFLLVFRWGCGSVIYLAQAVPVDMICDLMVGLGWLSTRPWWMHYDLSFWSFLFSMAWPRVHWSLLFATLVVFMDWIRGFMLSWSWPNNRPSVSITRKHVHLLRCGHEAVDPPYFFGSRNACRHDLCLTVGFWVTQQKNLDDPWWYMLLNKVFATRFCHGIVAAWFLYCFL